jgi:hypothetical protein
MRSLLPPTGGGFDEVSSLTTCDDLWIVVYMPTFGYPEDGGSVFV